MKRLIIILTLVISFLNNCSAEAAKNVTKDYKVVTNDGFSINAVLQYPKIKDKNNYSTVVLLHSLGYSSEWWENLPNELLNNGYAVLLIDLRGHGKSIYNSKLIKTSWMNLKNNAYKKYPNDVLTVIDYVKKENKRIFFDNWAIVGADIGAATGILTANAINYKPATIVMLSPVVETKSLYVPVKLAELNNIDILAIVGKKDINGVKTNKYLEKFAQSAYAVYTSDSLLTGMLMLKSDKSLDNVITAWIKQYLK